MYDAINSLAPVKPYPLGRVILISFCLALTACSSGPDLSSTKVPASFKRPTIDSSLRPKVTEQAMYLLGTPYKYGGSEPTGGLDCSGLIAYVFDNAANFRLPHNTAMIAKLTRPISNASLQPGDFVFFNTLNKPYSHMGIYIGKQQFIHAPSSRNNGAVRVESMSNVYFAKRYEGARTAFR